MAGLIITWKVPYIAQKMQWPWIIHLSSTNQTKGALARVSLIKLAHSLLWRNQGLPGSSTVLTLTLHMTWSDQHRDAYFGASHYTGVFLEENVVLAQSLWGWGF